jgi:hypothetical protein
MNSWLRWEFDATAEQIATAHKVADKWAKEAY